MSAFDKIIGDDDIKEDMFRTLDVFLHFEKYEALGVSFPAGIQIITNYGKKKHKYNFVVMTDKRKTTLDALHQWMK